MSMKVLLGDSPYDTKPVKDSVEIQNLPIQEKNRNGISNHEARKDRRNHQSARA